MTSAKLRTACAGVEQLVVGQALIPAISMK